MGLFDKLRNEFVDIIEWEDNTGDTLIWKFPRYQNEIKMGAKLTVRESQQAVFMNEGKIADVFQPGMYTLETQNLPILSSLKGFEYGFHSPFKADVFFISTKQFVDQRWGTRNAITVNDERFGMIELRAFGTFAFRIDDGAKFLKEIAGTNSEFSTEEITGQLRSIMVNKFTNTIGKGTITIDQVAGNVEDLSSICQEKLNEDFSSFGLKITKFLIENVSMPDDIKQEIFEYSRLNKIDLQKLAQMKAAKSIETAAENPGIGGSGVGMGVGISMGNMVASTLGEATKSTNQTQPQNALTPPPIPASVQYFVANDGKQTGPFDLTQITQLIQVGSLKKESLVWKIGMADWSTSSSVEEIAQLFHTIPPPLPQ